MKICLGKVWSTEYFYFRYKQTKEKQWDQWFCMLNDTAQTWIIYSQGETSKIPTSGLIFTTWIRRKAPQSNPGSTYEFKLKFWQTREEWSRQDGCLGANKPKEKCGFLEKFPFMYIIILIQNDGILISGFKSSLHLIWQSLLSVLSIVYIFNRKMGYRNHCYPDNIKGRRKKERANVCEEQANTRERGPAKECENERQREDDEKWKGKKVCTQEKKPMRTQRNTCGMVKGKRGRARQGEIKSTGERISCFDNIKLKVCVVEADMNHTSSISKFCTLTVFSVACSWKWNEPCDPHGFAPRAYWALHTPYFLYLNSAQFKYSPLLSVISIQFNPLYFCFIKYIIICFIFCFILFSWVHFLIHSLSCFIQFIKMYTLCHVLFISVRGISILLYVTLSPQHVVSISSSATSTLSCVLAHISVCLKQFHILILIFFRAFVWY